MMQDVKTKLLCTAAGTEVDGGADMHPDLLRLHGYWCRKKGTAPAPRRADIDPVELKSCLPNLLIFDVVDQASELLCSLCGTRIAQCLGSDITGEALSETYRRSGHLSPELLLQAARTQLPLYLQYEVARHGLVRDWEALVLPLARDDGAIAKLLVGVYRLALRSETTLPTAEARQPAGDSSARAGAISRAGGSRAGR